MTLHRAPASSPTSPGASFRDDQHIDAAATGLSCTNCRSKKLRCSREAPACERCSTHSLSCHYPRRRPRAARTRAAGTGDGTLSLILHRLQRIEKSHTPHSRRSPTPSTDGPPSLAQAGQTIATPASDLTAADDGTSPRAGKVPPSRRPADRGAVDGSANSLDVESMLSETFDRVREKRLRRTVGINAIAVGGVDIPPEKARTWIHNYFTYNPTETFLSLIDRRTIELIPEMLTMQHVTLEPCILVIYYVILWRGCYILNTRRSFHSPDSKFASQLHLCCRRVAWAWQKEATGSIMDFIAALFMTGMANECFDFEMSLEMHHLTCEYAKRLRLHSLDDNGYSSATGSVSTDDDRRGMWELIQKDLFYHLIYNKPGTLYTNLDKWQVNLPWLSLDSPPVDGNDVTTISFLLRSRLAFVLIHFFQTLEREPGNSAAIEPFCQEIEVLFQEWGVEDLIQRLVDNQIELWILLELVLTGYTCIIFMLRKAALLKPDSPLPTAPSGRSNNPRTDYASRASRRILDIAYNMFQVWKFPVSETVSYVLGAYRADIAYAHLASEAIGSAPPAQAAEDLRLLERVALAIGEAAQEEYDFYPLVRTMERINAEIAGKLRGRS